MKRPTVAWVVATAVFTVFSLASCGGAPGYGAPASSAVSTTPPSSATLGVKTATVNGTTTSVLVNAAGKTLYYFTPDTAQTAMCTGSCAQTWPPLLAPASANAVSADATLTGTISTLPDANGNQVVYNGHPLYTYSGDHAPGDTNGQGMLGEWFVATPTLAQNTGGSSTPPGYGY